MKTYGFPQLSDEWFAIRCGIPTASSASKILTPTGKISAQSEKYLNELLADRAGYGDERMEPTEWMQRGIDLEPEARALFEFDTGQEVTQVGFITNDDNTAGCSPDGIVEGLVDPVGFEVKCPKASTHFGYLRAGILPPYYAPQVHFSMAVTGIKRWAFMSYYPGLDPLIVTVDADEHTDKVTAAIAEFIDRLETESKRFGLERKS